MNIRQERILELLERTSTLTTLDLARELQVSDQTIRRDLKALAGNGTVEKFHGGVRLCAEAYEAPFAQRLQTHAEAKTAIASACAERVPDGATLFLDNSSTACFLARQLRRRSGLTIITLSLESARILAEAGDANRVIVPGGELRAADMTITGSNAIDYAARFSPDLFVMSVAAVSAQSGCMDFDLFEAEFKARLMPAAGQVILLADAGKFGHSGLIRTCALEHIDVLVCDLEPPAELRAAFAPSTQIVVADSDES
ncbi:MAG: DeoR/GlpR family DNA-binding transcription regulator [Azoarcus sp.]|nr:DeoR/GlpR family DNA-binding transcription regulator [Azoarcus sp.]